MAYIYQRYVDCKGDEDEEEEPEEPTRRKLPGGDYHDYDYENTLGVNLQLQTGAKAHKKARITNQLQKYYDDIYVDSRTAEATDLICGDPLKWWIEVGKQRYPLLFKIALDFLSIPATSCECERCFSRARRTISMDRNSLSAATIEALQLQRSWLQNQAVESDLNSLVDFIQKKRPLECQNRPSQPSTPSVTAATEATSSFSTTF
jgi:hypothetical protein